MAIAATSLVFACADDEKTGADDEVGDGDGDGETVGDGDGEPGDGDGEPGDGDGEPGDGDGEPGDGDGEPGDGDGEPGDGDGEPGDGDGEPGDGDGDGEPAQECQAVAEMLASELTQPDGGCAVIVRFNHETLAPIAWGSQCAPYSEMMLREEDARMLSTCCGEGMLLGPAEDNAMFVLYSPPEGEEQGGVSVISGQFAQRMFEATIASGEGGDIQYPEEWREPDNIGSGCGAEVPPGTGFDLTMEGSELEQEQLQKVLDAFADTALPLALEQSGMIQRTLTLAYPRSVDPLDPATAEYVLIIESGI